MARKPPSEPVKVCIPQVQMSQWPSFWLTQETWTDVQQGASITVRSPPVAAVTVADLHSQPWRIRTTKRQRPFGFFCSDSYCSFGLLGNTLSDLLPFAQWCLHPSFEVNTQTGNWNASRQRICSRGGSFSCLWPSGPTSQKKTMASDLSCTQCGLGDHGDWLFISSSSDAISHI